MSRSDARDKFETVVPLDHIAERSQKQRILPSDHDPDSVDFIHGRIINPGISILSILHSRAKFALPTRPKSLVYWELAYQRAHLIANLTLDGSVAIFSIGQ